MDESLIIFCGLMVRFVIEPTPKDDALKIGIAFFLFFFFFPFGRGEILD